MLLLIFELISVGIPRNVAICCDVASCCGALPTEGVPSKGTVSNYVVDRPVTVRSNYYGVVPQK
jgi:hypothetical protein